MAQLKGSKTHENLKHAFAGESQANRRYLYFARAADIEGYPEIGGLFRDTSEAETGHAFGHMDFLKPVGDPATDVAFGNTKQNLQSAIEGRDLRVHADVPGDGQDGPRGGLPRDRRVVRDPGEGGAEPRRTVHEGPGEPERALVSKGGLRRPPLNPRALRRSEFAFARSPLPESPLPPEYPLP